MRSQQLQRVHLEEQRVEQQLARRGPLRRVFVNAPASTGRLGYTPPSQPADTLTHDTTYRRLTKPEIVPVYEVLLSGLLQRFDRSHDVLLRDVAARVSVPLNL